MRLRSLSVFLLFMTATVLPAAAQNRRAVFTISGSVREEGGIHRPLENVMVTLRLLTGSTVSTAVTRGNGDFLMDGLVNGDYILEINLKDYQVYHENISLSGSSRMGMSIFLSRTGAKSATTAAAAAAAGQTISAHQLSVPHKAHDEFEKGMSLIYLKADYRGAIAQFQLAIRDFPNYYEAYAEEGSAYYQLQDVQHAEESLRKSIELSNGQYADAMFTLAALLTDTKRYSDAETVARQGLAADSTSWRGPFELARALNALKRPEEAEKAAQQSRDLMPDNAPVYLLLANIHIQRKDYPALLRDLDEYLRLSPGGEQAEQARKTRERVQKTLDDAKNSSADGKKGSQGESDDADDAADDKDSAEPDNSGLPSLPPPTGQRK